MWYDWMVGGMGRPQRARRLQPPRRRSSASGWRCSRSEGQERLCPVADVGARDPSPTAAGPGTFRGGCGVEKGGTLTRCAAHRHVLLRATARARSPGASSGGLPSIPHGVWLNKGRDGRALPGRGLLERLGGRQASPRPSAGGGGFGDPLERDPGARLRGRHRRVRLGRARAQGLRRRRRARSTPTWASTRLRRRGNRAASARAARGRARGSGWQAGRRGASRARCRRGELDVLDLVRRLRA